LKSTTAKPLSLTAMEATVDENLTKHTIHPLVSDEDTTVIVPSPVQCALVSCLQFLQQQLERQQTQDAQCLQAESQT